MALGGTNKDAMEARIEEQKKIESKNQAREQMIATCNPTYVELSD